MTERIKITTDDPAFLGTWERPDPPPKTEGIRLLVIPLLVLIFIAGLFIGVKIERGSPVPPDDEGFVNIEGHQGDVLVVNEDGTVRWCMKSDHGCHGAG